MASTNPAQQSRALPVVSSFREAQAGSDVAQPTTQAASPPEAKVASTIEDSIMSKPATLRTHSTLPPYESTIDMRIPPHFASKDMYCRDATDEDESLYTRGRMAAEYAAHFFKHQNICGYLRLARARYLDPAMARMREGPLFFAVIVDPEHMSRWPRVDRQLREIIVILFEDFKDSGFHDPPLRWFLQHRRVLLGGDRESIPLNHKGLHQREISPGLTFLQSTINSGEQFVDGIENSACPHAGTT